MGDREQKPGGEKKGGERMVNLVKNTRRKLGA